MAGAKGAVYSHSVGKRFNVARWATCRPNRRDFGGREQEKSLTRFQTSVSYAKLPTTFVGGVSYGKSRTVPPRSAERTITVSPGAATARFLRLPPVTTPSA